MCMDVMEYVVVYNRLVNLFEGRDYYEKPYKGYVDCYKNSC